MLVMVFLFTMTGLDAILAHAFDYSYQAPDTRKNNLEVNRDAVMTGGSVESSAPDAFLDMQSGQQNMNQVTTEISATSLNVLKSEYGNLLDTVSLTTLAERSSSGLNLDSMVNNLLAESESPEGTVDGATMEDANAEVDSASLDPAAMVDVVDASQGPVSLSLEIKPNVAALANQESGIENLPIPASSVKEPETETVNVNTAEVPVTETDNNDTVQPTTVEQPKTENATVVVADTNANNNNNQTMVEDPGANNQNQNMVEDVDAANNNETAVNPDQNNTTNKGSEQPAENTNIIQKFMAMVTGENLKNETIDVPQTEQPEAAAKVDAAVVTDQPDGSETAVADAQNNGSETMVDNGQPDSTQTTQVDPTQVNTSDKPENANPTLVQNLDNGEGNIQPGNNQTEDGDQGSLLNIFTMVVKDEQDETGNLPGENDDLDETEAKEDGEGTDPESDSVEDPSASDDALVNADADTNQPETATIADNTKMDDDTSAVALADQDLDIPTDVIDPHTVPETDLPDNEVTTVENVEDVEEGDTLPEGDEKDKDAETDNPENNDVADADADATNRPDAVDTDIDAPEVDTVMDDPGVDITLAEGPDTPQVDALYQPETPDNQTVEIESPDASPVLDVDAASVNLNTTDTPETNLVKVGKMTEEPAVVNNTNLDLGATKETGMVGPTTNLTLEKTTTTMVDADNTDNTTIKASTVVNETATLTTKPLVSENPLLASTAPLVGTGTQVSVNNPVVQMVNNLGTNMTNGSQLLFGPQTPNLVTQNFVATPQLAKYSANVPLEVGMSTVAPLQSLDLNMMSTMSFNPSVTGTAPPTSTGPPNNIATYVQAIAAAVNNQNYSIPPRPNVTVTQGETPAWPDYSDLADDYAAKGDSYSTAHVHRDPPEHGSGGGSCAKFMASPIGKVVMFVVTIILTIVTVGTAAPILLAIIIIIEAIVAFVPLPPGLAIALTILTAFLGGWASAIGKIANGAMTVTATLAAEVAKSAYTFSAAAFKAAISALGSPAVWGEIAKMVIAKGIMMWFATQFPEASPLVFAAVSILASIVAAGVAEMFTGKEGVSLLKRFAQGFMKELKAAIGMGPSGFDLKALVGSTAFKSLMAVGIEMIATAVMEKAGYTEQWSKMVGSVIGSAVTGAIGYASDPGIGQTAKLMSLVVIPAIADGMSTFYAIYVTPLMEDQGFSAVQTRQFGNNLGAFIRQFAPAATPVSRGTTQEAKVFSFKNMPIETFFKEIKQLWNVMTKPESETNMAPPKEPEQQTSKQADQQPPQPTNPQPVVVQTTQVNPEQRINTPMPAAGTIPQNVPMSSATISSEASVSAASVASGGVGNNGKAGFGTGTLGAGVGAVGLTGLGMVGTNSAIPGATQANGNAMIMVGGPNGTNGQVGAVPHGVAENYSTRSLGQESDMMASSVPVAMAAPEAIPQAAKAPETAHDSMDSTAARAPSKVEQEVTESPKSSPTSSSKSPTTVPEPKQEAKQARSEVAKPEPNKATTDTSHMNNPMTDTTNKSTLAPQPQQQQDSTTMPQEGLNNRTESSSTGTRMENPEPQRNPSAQDQPRSEVKIADLDGVRKMDEIITPKGGDAEISTGGGKGSGDADTSNNTATQQKNVEKNSESNNRLLESGGSDYATLPAKSGDKGTEQVTAVGSSAVAQPAGVQNFAKQLETAGALSAGTNYSYSQGQNADGNTVTKVFDNTGRLVGAQVSRADGTAQSAQMFDYQTPASVQASGGGDVAKSVAGDQGVQVKATTIENGQITQEQNLKIEDGKLVPIADQPTSSGLAADSAKASQTKGEAAKAERRNDDIAVSADASVVGGSGTPSGGPGGETAKGGGSEVAKGSVDGSEPVVSGDQTARSGESKKPAPQRGQMFNENIGTEENPINVSFKFEGESNQIVQDASGKQYMVKLNENNEFVKTGEFRMEGNFWQGKERVFIPNGSTEGYGDKGGSYQYESVTGGKATKVADQVVAGFRDSNGDLHAMVSTISLEDRKGLSGDALKAMVMAENASRPEAVDAAGNKLSVADTRAMGNKAVGELVKQVNNLTDNPVGRQAVMGSLANAELSMYASNPDPGSLKAIANHVEQSQSPEMHLKLAGLQSADATPQEALASVKTAMDLTANDNTMSTSQKAAVNLQAAEMMSKMENLGSPQDIQKALDNARDFLVQSKPEELSASMAAMSMQFQDLASRIGNAGEQSALKNVQIPELPEATANMIQQLTQKVETATQNMKGGDSMTSGALQGSLEMGEGGKVTLTQQNADGSSVKMEFAPNDQGKLTPQTVSTTDSSGMPQQTFKMDSNTNAMKVAEQNTRVEVQLGGKDAQESAFVNLMLSPDRTQDVPATAVINGEKCSLIIKPDNTAVATPVETSAGKTLTHTAEVLKGSYDVKVNPDGSGATLVKDGEVFNGSGVPLQSDQNLADAGLNPATSQHLLGKTAFTFNLPDAGKITIIGSAEEIAANKCYITGTDYFASIDKKVEYVARFDGKLQSIHLADGEGTVIQYYKPALMFWRNDTMTMMTKTSADGNQVARAFYDFKGQMTGYTVTYADAGVQLEYGANKALTPESFAKLRAMSGAGFTLEMTGNGFCIRVNDSGKEYYFSNEGRTLLKPSETTSAGSGTQQVVEFDFKETMVYSIAKIENGKLSNQEVQVDNIKRKHILYQSSADGSMSRTETVSTLTGEPIMQITQNFERDAESGNFSWNTRQVRASEGTLKAEGYWPTEAATYNQSLGANQQIQTDTYGFYTVLVQNDGMMLSGMTTNQTKVVISAKDGATSYRATGTIKQLNEIGMPTAVMMQENKDMGADKMIQAGKDGTYTMVENKDSGTTSHAIQGKNIHGATATVSIGDKGRTYQAQGTVAQLRLTGYANELFRNNNLDPNEQIVANADGQFTVFESKAKADGVVTTGMQGTNIHDAKITFTMGKDGSFQYQAAGTKEQLQKTGFTAITAANDALSDQKQIQANKEGNFTAFYSLEGKVKTVGMQGENFVQAKATLTLGPNGTNYQLKGTAEQLQKSGYSNTLAKNDALGDNQRIQPDAKGKSLTVFEISRDGETSIGMQGKNIHDAKITFSTNQKGEMSYQAEGTRKQLSASGFSDVLAAADKLKPNQTITGGKDGTLTGVFNRTAAGESRGLQGENVNGAKATLNLGADGSRLYQAEGTEAQLKASGLGKPLDRNQSLTDPSQVIKADAKGRYTAFERVADHQTTLGLQGENAGGAKATLSIDGQGNVNYQAEGTLAQLQKCNMDGMVVENGKQSSDQQIIAKKTEQGDVYTTFWSQKAGEKGLTLGMQGENIHGAKITLSKDAKGTIGLQAEGSMDQLSKSGFGRMLQTNANQPKAERVMPNKAGNYTAFWNQKAGAAKQFGMQGINGAGAKTTVIFDKAGNITNYQAEGTLAQLSACGFKNLMDANTALPDNQRIKAGKGETFQASWVEKKDGKAFGMEGKNAAGADVTLGIRADGTLQYAIDGSIAQLTASGFENVVKLNAGLNADQQIVADAKKQVYSAFWSKKGDTVNFGMQGKNIHGAQITLTVDQKGVVNYRADGNLAQLAATGFADSVKANAALNDDQKIVPNEKGEYTAFWSKQEEKTSYGMMGKNQHGADITLSVGQDGSVNYQADGTVEALKKTGLADALTLNEAQDPKARIVMDKDKTFTVFFVKKDGQITIGIQGSNKLQDGAKITITKNEDGEVSYRAEGTAKQLKEIGLDKALAVNDKLTADEKVLGEDGVFTVFKTEQNGQEVIGLQGDNKHGAEITATLSGKDLTVRAKGTVEELEKTGFAAKEFKALNDKNADANEKIVLGKDQELTMVRTVRDGETGIAMTGENKFGADVMITRSAEGAFTTQITGTVEQLKSMGLKLDQVQDKAVTDGKAKGLFGGAQNIEVKNGRFTVVKNDGKYNVQFTITNGKDEIQVVASVEKGTTRTVVTAHGGMAGYASTYTYTTPDKVNIQYVLRGDEATLNRLGAKGTQLLNANSQKSAENQIQAVNGKYVVMVSEDGQALQGKLADGRMATLSRSNAGEYSFTSEKTIMVNNKPVKVMVSEGGEGTVVQVGKTQLQMGEHVTINANEDGNLVIKDSRGVIKELSTSGENKTGWFRERANDFKGFIHKVEVAWENMKQRFSDMGALYNSVEGFWASAGVVVLDIFAGLGTVLILAWDVLVAGAVVLVLEEVWALVEFSFEWTVNVALWPVSITVGIMADQSLGKLALNLIKKALSVVFWPVDKLFELGGKALMWVGEKYAQRAEAAFAKGDYFAGVIDMIGATVFKVAGENLAIIVLVALSALVPGIGGVVAAIMLAKDAIVNGLGHMFESFFVEPFNKVGTGLSQLFQLSFGQNLSEVTVVRQVINAMSMIGGGVIGIILAAQMTRQARAEFRKARNDAMMEKGLNTLKEQIKSGEIKIENLLGKTMAEVIGEMVGKSPETFAKTSWGKTKFGDAAITQKGAMKTLNEIALKGDGVKGAEMLVEMLTAKDFNMSKLSIEVEAPKPGLMQRVMSKITKSESSGASGKSFKPLTEMIKPATIAPTRAMQLTTGMGAGMAAFVVTFAKHQVEMFTNLGKSIRMLSNQYGLSFLRPVRAIGEAISGFVNGVKRMNNYVAQKLTPGSAQRGINRMVESSAPGTITNRVGSFLQGILGRPFAPGAFRNLLSNGMKALTGRNAQTGPGRASAKTGTPAETAAEVEGTVLRSEKTEAQDTQRAKMESVETRESSETGEAGSAVAMKGTEGAPAETTSGQKTAQRTGTNVEGKSEAGVEGTRPGTKSGQAGSETLQAAKNMVEQRQGQLDKVNQALDAAKQGKASEVQIQRLEAEQADAKAALSRAKTVEARIADLTLKQADAMERANDSSVPKEQRSQAEKEAATLEKKIEIETVKAEGGELAASIAKIEARMEAEPAGATDAVKARLESLKQKQESVENRQKRMEGQIQLEQQITEAVAKQEGLQQEIAQNQEALTKADSPSARKSLESTGRRMQKEAQKAELEQKILEAEKKILDLEQTMDTATEASAFMEALKGKGETMENLGAMRTQLAAVQKQLQRAEMAESTARTPELLNKMAADMGMSKAAVEAMVDKMVGELGNSAERAAVKQALVDLMNGSGRQRTQAIETLEANTLGLKALTESMLKNGMEKQANQFLDQVSEAKGLNRAQRNQLAEAFGLQTRSLRAEVERQFGEQLKRENPLGREDGSRTGLTKAERGSLLENASRHMTLEQYDQLVKAQLNGENITEALKGIAQGKGRSLSEIMEGNPAARKQAFAEQLEKTLSESGVEMTAARKQMVAELSENMSLSSFRQLRAELLTAPDPARSLENASKSPGTLLSAQARNLIESNMGSQHVMQSGYSPEALQALEGFSAAVKKGGAVEEALRSRKSVSEALDALAEVVDPRPETMEAARKALNESKGGQASEKAVLELARKMEVRSMVESLTLEQAVKLATAKDVENTVLELSINKTAMDAAKAEAATRFKNAEDGLESSNTKLKDAQTALDQVKTDLETQTQKVRQEATEKGMERAEAADHIRKATETLRAELDARTQAFDKAQIEVEGAKKSVSEAEAALKAGEPTSLSSQIKADAKAVRAQLARMEQVENAKYAEHQAKEQFNNARTFDQKARAEEAVLKASKDLEITERMASRSSGVRGRVMEAWNRFQAGRDVAKSGAQLEIDVKRFMQGITDPAERAAIEPQVTKLRDLQKAIEADQSKLKWASRLGNSKSAIEARMMENIKARQELIAKMYENGYSSRLLESFGLRGMTDRALMESIEGQPDRAGEVIRTVLGEVRGQLLDPAQLAEKAGVSKELMTRLCQELGQTTEIFSAKKVYETLNRPEFKSLQPRAKDIVKIMEEQLGGKVTFPALEGKAMEQARATIEARLKESGLELNAQSRMILEEMLVQFQADAQYRFFTPELPMLRFLFRQTELHYLNMKLHVENPAMKLVIGEALQLAMGGGKSCSPLTLKAAAELFRKTSPEGTPVPAQLYMTVNPALVKQILGENAFVEMKKSGTLVELTKENEAVLKDVIENGFQNNKTYVMDNETLKHIVLEMRSQGKSDIEISKLLQKNLGTVAWDEFHAAFHTTDTIIGASGITPYLSEGAMKQLMPASVELVRSYAAVREWFMGNENVKAGLEGKLFENVESSVGKEVRSQVRFTKEALAEIFDKTGLDYRKAGDAYLLDKMAQVLAMKNGREYNGHMTAEGKIVYGTMEGGVGKPNTIFGDQMQAAFTNVEIFLQKTNMKFAEMDNATLQTKYRPFMESMIEALVHTTTERVTMMEAMNLMGAHNIVGFSGTFEGVQGVLNMWGKQLVRINTEPVIDLVQVMGGEAYFQVKVGNDVLMMRKDLRTGELKLELSDEAISANKAFTSHVVELMGKPLFMDVTSEMVGNTIRVNGVQRTLGPEMFKNGVIDISKVQARFGSEVMIREVRQGAKVVLDNVDLKVTADMVGKRINGSEKVVRQQIVTHDYNTALADVMAEIDVALKKSGRATESILLDEASVRRFIDANNMKVERTEEGHLTEASAMEVMAKMLQHPGEGKVQLVRIDGIAPELWTYAMKTMENMIKTPEGCRQERIIFAPKIGEGLNTVAIKGSHMERMGAALHQLDMRPIDVYRQAMKRLNVYNEKSPGNVEYARAQGLTGMSIDFNQTKNITGSEKARMEALVQEVKQAMGEGRELRIRLESDVNGKRGLTLDGSNANVELFQRFNDLLVGEGKVSQYDAEAGKMVEVNRNHSTMTEAGVAKTILEEVDAQKAQAAQQTQAGIETEKTVSVSVEKSSAEYMPTLAKKVESNLPSILRKFQGVSDLVATRTGAESSKSTLLKTESFNPARMRSHNPWTGIGLIRNFVDSRSSVLENSAARIQLVNEYSRTWQDPTWQQQNTETVTQLKANFGTQWFEPAMTDKFGADWRTYQKLGTALAIQKQGAPLVGRIPLIGNAASRLLSAGMAEYRLRTMPRQEYATAVRNIARVSEKISELTKAPETTTMVYRGQTMNLDAAENYLTQQLAVVRHYAETTGYRPNQKLEELCKVERAVAVLPQALHEEAVATLQNQEPAYQFRERVQNGWGNMIRNMQQARFILPLFQVENGRIKPTSVPTLLIGAAVFAVLGFTGLPTMGLAAGLLLTPLMQPLMKQVSRFMPGSGKMNAMASSGQQVSLGKRLLFALPMAMLMGTLMGGGLMGGIASAISAATSAISESTLSAQVESQTQVAIRHQRSETMRTDQQSVGSMVQQQADQSLVRVWKQQMEGKEDNGQTAVNTLAGLLKESRFGNIDLRVHQQAHHYGYMHLLAAVLSLVPQAMDSVHAIDLGSDSVKEPENIMDADGSRIRIDRDSIRFLDQRFSNQLLTQTLMAMTGMFNDAEYSALEAKLQQSPYFKEYGQFAVVEFMKQYIMDGESLKSLVNEAHAGGLNWAGIPQTVEGRPKNISLYEFMQGKFNGREFANQDLLELNQAMGELENTALPLMAKLAGQIESKSISRDDRLVLETSFNAQFGITYESYKKMMSPSLMQRILTKQIGRSILEGEQPVTAITRYGQTMFGFGAALALAGGVVAGILMAATIPAITGAVLAVLGMAIAMQGLLSWMLAEKIAFNVNPAAAVIEGVKISKFGFADTAKQERATELGITTMQLLENKQFLDAVEGLKIRGTEQMISESSRTRAIRAVLSHLVRVMESDVDREMKIQLTREITQVLGFLRFDIDMHVKQYADQFSVTMTPEVEPQVLKHDYKIGRLIRRLKGLGVGININVAPSKQPKLKITGSAA